MGLLDNLTELSKGVADIFKAPVGLVWDTARAITSSEYNPGFSGTVGKATEQAFGGLVGIGNAFGFNTLGATIRDTPVGQGIRNVLREGELLYNTEFQLQENDTFAPFQALGAKPGDVSLQRIGATATGFSGSLTGLTHGGDLGEVNLYRQWQKSATRTPGQAWVEQAVIPDFYQRTPEEQDEIRNTAWYNISSGVIDAAGRWFTDPGVIAGKGYKFARKKYFTFKLADAIGDEAPRIIRDVDHAKTFKNMGYQIGEEAEPIGGVPVVKLKAGRNDTVYAVTRRSALTGDAQGNLTQPRYPGTDYRPMTLHGADELDEVKRYAAALHAIDQTDAPVILEINAEGLPVIFEDFDRPYFPDPKSADPSEAAFFTLAESIPEGQVKDVIFPDRKELDVREYLDEMQPDYMEPPSKVNPRFYNPDGSPIEPDQTVMFEDFMENFNTASSLNPVDAEKYLITRQRQRNNGDVGQNLVENASNNKTFQSVLNWMDGKTDDDIRRVLFPNTPYGGILSVWLADAKSYSERRTILLASMGHKTPELNTLAPLVKAKLGKLLEEQERVMAGKPPSESLQAMMGVRNRLSDIPAESMGEVFDEMMGGLEDQAKAYDFLDRISDIAPIDELSMPVFRRGTNALRKTSFYQNSSLARPIRNVVEWRPHQFLHIGDTNADIQIVRQMEEARPLGITDQETAALRRSFNEATTPQQKMLLVEKMNDRIVKAAADTAGLSEEEFRDLLNHSRQGHQSVEKILTSRRFGPNDRDIVRTFDAETGEMVQQILPMLSTQTTGWMSLVDAHQLNKVAKRAAKFKKNYGYIPSEIMQGFYQLWKPSVLLRGGWMLRVVSDEQLRILAFGGSLLRHIAAIEAGESVPFTGIFKPGLSKGQRVSQGYATITGTLPITSGAQKTASVLTRAAEKLGLLDKDHLAIMREVGTEDLVSARSSFGGASESTLHGLQAIMGRDEFTFLDHLYNKGTGQWRSIDASDPMFGAAWSRVLKEQFGRDPLVRQVMEQVLEVKKNGIDLNEETVNQIYSRTKKWLKETAEGREVSDRVPWRGADPNRWVDDVFETVADYTAGFDEDLLRGSMNQRITRNMLEAIDERNRPDLIHAEMISQVTGTSEVTGFIRDFISETFDLMGRLPTDTLSRQPFFKNIYAKELLRRQRLRLAQGLDLDETSIKRMSEGARQVAINETKTLLYDLAETSRFGHMSRFILPFYPAWQEVLKVWGKLAIDDPSIAARGRLLWKAPNAAGLVYTDDDGQEFLQFRLSEKTADNLDLTGWKRYIATGGVRFGKSSFNLILNNPLPSVGPPIQYPVNEIVKRRPEWEESVNWLLPYGVTTNSSSIFLSPLVRQLRSEIEGRSGDKSYTRSFADALTWMDVEYRSGRRSVPPSVDEAHDVADKIWIMRLITRLGAPAQPIFDSPMQPYIDIYRDMQDNLGPEGANEAFLNEYGSEFMAVTLSRTVSKTGIPPTAEAEVARREYEDILQKYPEYGSLILGDKAIGEFSNGAFAAQLARPIDPDNPFSEMERTYRPTELDPRTGRIIEVDRRLGWQEYIKAMDVIDLERKRLGLPNLRVADASQLAEAKRAVTQFLGQKYPSWWEDFNTRDDLKWGSRVTALSDMTKLSAMADRPDMQGLSTYLAARQAILQELNRRRMVGGASTLSAVSNQDLQNLWDTVVIQILDENVAFGPLYFRYLEGDPVELGR